MKKTIKNFGLSGIFFLIFTFCLLTSPTAEAHRYHTSLTVMEYNPAEKTIETTIQLFTHDLAEVLEKRHSKRIDLEKSETDKLVLDYLKENFSLFDTNEKPLQLNWVGRELDVDKIFLYVEIPFTESLAGKKMQNTMFFETYHEQTNLVILKFEQKKADLLFKVGDKFKEIQVGSKKELDS